MNVKTIVKVSILLLKTYVINADEDKKLNATYIISVARKLGCSIFLLPEDIIEVSLFLCTWILELL